MTLKMHRPVNCQKWHLTLLFAVVSLSLTTLGFGAQEKPADRIEGFSQLPVGDRLDLTLSAVNCFNVIEYNLSCTSETPTNNSVRRVKAQWNGKGAKRLNKHLGKERAYLLSGSEIAGLDALLVFYRTNTLADICTVRTTVKISQFREKTLIANEQFKDNSCRSFNTPGVITIMDISRRMLPPGTQN